MVDPYEIAKLFNEAIDADRYAVQELLSVRVPCSPVLAAHPTIVVDEGSERSTLVPPGSYRLGVLGLLNGLFGPPHMHRDIPVYPLQPVYLDGRLVRVDVQTYEQACERIDAALGAVEYPGGN